VCVYVLGARVCVGVYILQRARIGSDNVVCMCGDAYLFVRVIREVHV